jgi:hypothetical protein
MAQLGLSPSQSRQAAETHQKTPNGPSPHERPKDLHEHIDEFIVEVHRTKDPPAENPRADLLQALELLKEARVIVASNYESMDPSKPKDTGTLVSQIWDDVRQLKR